MERQPQPLTAEIERRLSTRIPVNEKATLLQGHLGSATHCTLMDLCLDGCRVRTDAEIRVDRGARVELVFRVAGTAFRLAGLTEWTARTREIGVLFTDMSPRREAELVEALGELGAAWQARQAEQRRAEEVLQAAQELVQQRTAEFEAKAAREAALRADAEQAARDKQEAEEGLRSANRELCEAEKAAQQLAGVATSEAKSGSGVAEAVRVTGASAGNPAAANPAAGTQPAGPALTSRTVQDNIINRFNLLTAYHSKYYVDTEKN